MTVYALVFAKYPEPGKVKTRLSPPLSPVQAAEIHRAALRTTCELIGSIHHVRTVLVATPDRECRHLADELGTLIDDHWPQGEGTLGDRLERAGHRAFQDGASHLLLFGADSPTTPEDFIRQAITALEECDAVAGPCDDGGYYLLGMRTPQPALFQNIDWGSERVMEQTRERARRSGIHLHELPLWYDLDRVDDLERAADDLGVGDTPPMRRALQRTIDRVLDQLEGNG